MHHPQLPKLREGLNLDGVYDGQRQKSKNETDCGEAHMQVHRV